MRSLFLITCGVLGLATAVQGVELSFIRGPLENTGVDSDASGTVRSQFKGTDSKLWANLKGLTPDAAYQFTVDGAVEADFTANADGTAALEFRLVPTGAQHALDFDPRGKEIAISDGTDTVLSMIYSGPEEPTSLVVDERTDLTRSDVAVRGNVRARYLDQKNKTRFILHLLGLENGLYTIRLDGEALVDVDLTKGRSAMVSFEANKHGTTKGSKGKGKGSRNKHALDFDPRGLLIEVVLDDVVVFSDIMEAKVHGLPIDEPDDEGVITLVSTGEDADAAGQAVVVTDAEGEITLTISVSQLPVGDYAVVVAGSQRGTITVADDGLGGTSGEVVFATITEGTQVELDFPLVGTLEISQGATVFLSGSF